MSEVTEERARRRHGEELQAALLDAAWDELVAVGYARFTMESVATRAHTGIAVLYRRWSNKDELVLSAIERYSATHPIEAADTGSLRGDLIAVLTAFSQARATFIAIAASSAFSGLLAETGLTPTQVRERLIATRRESSSQTIYRRAAERGELEVDRIPAPVLTMPFDLVRHDLLMSLEAVGADRIRAIVDDMFLPLVATYRSDPTN